MGPEQVNATQLRDSSNTLAVVSASTLSDQSCMVGLTHNLEVEIFGEEMPVISVITFQNNLAVMSQHRQHQKAEFNIEWGIGLNE